MHQLSNIASNAVSIAHDDERQRIAVCTSDGRVVFYRLDTAGEWVEDTASADFFNTILASHRQKDYKLDVTAAFFFEYVFLSIGCMFGLSNGDNVAIVLVDIKQQVHRLVAHGSRLSTNAKPIGTRLGLIYCPLSDGIAALRHPQYELAWLDLPDGGDPWTLISPRGLSYLPQTNQLVVLDSVESEPDRIRVYTLDSQGKSIGRSDYNLCEWGVNCRGLVANPHSGEVAYVLSEDDWIVSGVVATGMVLPFATFCVHPVGGEPRRIPLLGVAGINVGFRPTLDYQFTKGAPPSYVIYQAEEEFYTSILIPLDEHRYWLSVPGGTLCEIDTRSGSQATIHQFPSAITAMCHLVNLSSVCVGLKTGDLFLVRYTADV